MNKELAAIQKALDGQDFATVQDLSTAYVQKHPDVFDEHRNVVAGAESEGAAREKIVGQIQSLREAAANLDGAAKDSIVEHMLLAEVWLQHRWHPLDIGGHVGPQPEVRNPDGDVAPRVRNQK